MSHKKHRLHSIKNGQTLASSKKNSLLCPKPILTRFQPLIAKSEQKEKIEPGNKNHPIFCRAILWAGFLYRESKAISEGALFNGVF